VPVQDRSYRCFDCKRKGKVMRDKQRRDRRKQEGTCYHCGRPKSSEEVSRCERCMARGRATYYKAKKENKCTKCRTRDTQHGKSRCEICLVRNRTITNASRDRARSQGKCGICKRNEALDGVATCAECRISKNEISLRFYYKTKQRSERPRRQ
jgi:hypothetical protein